MRKTLLGLFLLLAAAVMAGQRTPEQAAEIAAQFTNQQPQLRRMHASDRQCSTMRLAHTARQLNSEDAAFYVFNQENNNGFVVVSADDRTVEDVILYSDQGSFDPQTVNPSFRWWLDRFAEEITALQTMEVSDQPKVRKATQVTAISPLLKNSKGQSINWYQEAPYYNLCPMDQRDNTRSLTGCVATAASMIMYKWRWPVKGTGSSSYTWYDCLNDNCQNPSEYKTKTLSANYGETVYDWDNMLPSYENKSYTTDQANAVATLMYHCGVASEMQYGGDETGGSGTLTDLMAGGLIKYFGYKLDKFVSQYSKNDYYYYGGDVPEGVTAEWEVTTEQIANYFNADLEAGRPIIMGGESRKSGGHEFVCDGRDSSGKFHINWGWEGSGNCYTALTTLQPDGSAAKFNENLDAIIGLEPDKSQEAIENTVVEAPAANKVLENSMVVIVREDAKYNVLGQRIQ